ncbi:DUF72 domain-containing protein [Duganella sp. FT94W]|uniref:DUF72 domain-containing protein n=1 Tax=Duganella lactea TaxID=2692173 RepID=A0ABW9V8G6_9BURK|nr:DUF72 domain-containing protein [Duganella lactea]MYM35658.1 DUF72 domain-containing protein [Duganella lactea]
MAQIRAGIGGWDFAPWRQSFYPPGLPLKQQLDYASRQLTSIEINGTFYRTAKPEHYASWAEKTPDDFVFSVKATRYATHRKVLAEAGESIARFMDSGLTELGDKLGPMLWQLAATKQFDPDDIAAFFKLLPARLGKRTVRHVLEPRHDSFLCDEYLQLARKHQVATVITDSPKFPHFDRITGDFVYLRLMDARGDIDTGYTRPALKQWLKQAQAWQAEAQSGQVYVYFINGAKERAPAAARQFLSLL